MTALHPKEN